MKVDTKIDLKELKADGGASKNSFLMQFQSDISAISVNCPKSPEATALGAAFLAGLVSGFWKDRTVLKKLSSDGKIYKPEMLQEEINERLNNWHRAVKCAKDF